MEKNTIFQGKSGLFKRERALAAARAILSPKCLDTHPDFLLVEPVSGKIPVSDAGKIAEFLSYATSEADRKVVVIDKCHMATTEFLQAILKLLEDYSQKAVFLLTTEEPLMPTIHSRCNTISVKEWSMERMVAWITEQNLPLDSVAVMLSERRPGLYRDLIKDKEFLTKAKELKENLLKKPNMVVPALGAFEEGYYESERKEKEFLIIGFIEKIYSEHLLDCKVLGIDSMLDAVDLCSDERGYMKSRAYGKVENNRFYRRLHTILCENG